MVRLIQHILIDSQGGGTFDSRVPYEQFDPKKEREEERNTIIVRVKVRMWHQIYLHISHFKGATASDKSNDCLHN